jgi:drug/metabolite transporter (DMT)-like permease
MHMMFGRCVVGVVFLLGLAAIFRISILGRRRGVLLGLGLTGSVSILCLITALVLLPLFQALILFYLYPVIAALVSPPLTGDRIDRIDWGLICLAILGAGLVLWTGGTEPLRLQWGHLCALGAAVFYGLTLTLVRRVSPVNHPLTPVLYVCVLGTLLSLPSLALAEQPLPLSGPGLGGMIGIGLFAALAHLAGNKALTSLSSPHVGIVSMLEVVFSSLCGYVLFSEGVGWSALLGALLIVAGSLGLTRRAKGPASRELP